MINSYNKDAMDALIMQVYGITRDQYFLFNSDYRKLLLDNYFQILKSRSKEEKVMIKKKALNIFKKIGG